jgi:hypothetical protein
MMTMGKSGQARLERHRDICRTKIEDDQAKAARP